MYNVCWNCDIGRPCLRLPYVHRRNYANEITGLGDSICLEQLKAQIYNRWPRSQQVCALLKSGAAASWQCEPSETGSVELHRNP